MSDVDILGQAETTVETTTGDSNPLDQLVGEGKKFKTPEDLARGKLESDAFIQKLQDENRAALEELESLRGSANKEETKANLIKEVREAIEAQHKSSTDGNQSLSEEDLTKLVRNVLQGEKEVETKTSNRRAANELVLNKAKGDPEVAKSIVADAAKANGLSVSELVALSEKSPQAFAKLIGEVPKAPNATSGSTQAIQGQRTESYGEGTVKTHIDGTPTKAFFDAKRREMGTHKFIHDKVLQRQYLDAAMKLGDAFNQ